MSFAITSEQEELRELLRRFLSRKSTSADVRHLMGTPDGFDPLIWKQLAEELGLQGLGIPEQYGGAGYGALELAIVFEEMGRALLVAPFFSTVALATPLLLAIDDEAAHAKWLPAIADGSLRATVVIDDWDLSAITTVATPAGDGWTLDGSASVVLDAQVSGLLLVVARTADGLGVFAVTSDAMGLTRTPIEALDLTRKLSRVELVSVSGARIGTGDASAAVARALDVAVTALAAESVGAAGQCLDTAVEYAKIRVQFGKPIGSFQAIKHKCANMLMSVESARSAAYYAAWTAAEGSDELPKAAAVAKAYCSEAFLRVAAESIQVHGGIGFTWEHDAHLYFRRAKSSQQLLGDPQSHRNRVAALAGI